MGKLFEVREFDKIIGNPHYREDTRYRYLEERKFQKLIDFTGKIVYNKCKAT